jgi:crotonobetainyl-CoA hydratase
MIQDHIRTCSKVPEKNVMSEFVRISRDGGILEIVLDKPKANAIDIGMSQALGQAFVELRDDPDLKVGIVTGAGERIFCAGWDLKAVERGEMSLDNWWEDDYGPGGFAGLTELWDLNKPVIAALNGITLGGGVEILLACDLVIAAEHVSIGMPEMPLGIVPDAGAVQRLPRRIPYNKAIEMLLLGERMGAAEAAHYGLINKVVPADQLLDTARDWARTLAGYAPLAVQSIKEIMRAIEADTVQESFQTLRNSPDLPTYRKLLGSEDAAEGISAFVDKREAKFKGK